MFELNIKRIQKMVVKKSTNPQLIDGKRVAKAIRKQIREYVEKLETINVRPKLVVLIVGADPASEIYVRHKIKACKETGIESELVTLPADISKGLLFEKIDQLGSDNNVDGILVQFPLPKHLDEFEIVQRISPEKDVDGFHSENVGRLIAKKGGLEPCTPRGMMTLMKVYGIETTGKRAVVIGRSTVVGLPMFNMMVRANSTVTVCHSRTVDLKARVKEADIVIAAVGVNQLVRGEWIKPGAAVFDVGINRGDDGKLKGDVNFSECIDHVGKITPVPGGVGPMTVATLLENTLHATIQRRKIENNF